MPRKYSSTVYCVHRFFIFSLFFLSFPAHADPKNPPPRPCGLAGTVSERIADCNTKQDFSSQNFSWSLVHRNIPETSYWPIKVWLDNTTKLIWGERFMDSDLGYIFKFKRARSLCKESIYLPFGGNIEGLSWYLPTEEEYVLAESHKLTRALKLFPVAYWTSTPEEVEDIVFSGGGSLFHSMEGKIIGMYKSDRYAVRCVAKLAEIQHSDLQSKQ